MEKAQKQIRIYVAGSNSVDDGAKAVNRQITEDMLAEGAAELAMAVTTMSLETIIAPLVEGGSKVTVVIGSDDGDFNKSVVAWCETHGVKTEKVDLGGLFSGNNYSHTQTHLHGMPQFVLAEDKFVGHARKSLAALALDAALLVPNREFVLGDNARKVKRLLVENLGGGCILAESAICDMSEMAQSVSEELDTLRDLEKTIHARIVAESVATREALPSKKVSC